MGKIRTSKDLTDEEILQLVYGGREEDIDRALKIAEEEIRRGEGVEFHKSFRKFRKEHGF